MPRKFSILKRVRLILFGALALLICVCGLSPAALAAGGCSEASFNAASILTLETAAYDLIKGDFNGDGHVDLAATNNFAGEVVILLGRGGGEGFGPPVSFAAGAGATYLNAGDLNGDGKLDLVTGNSVFGANTGSISVLLGDGSGKFGAPNTINLPYAPGRSEIADFNNDGKPDLATGILGAGVASGRISILLGDGTGSFTQAANSPFTLTTSGGRILAGDFNADGRHDLAVTGYPSGLLLLLGDGHGGFVQSSNVITAESYVISFTAADFNGDGHQDFALVNSNGAAQTYVSVVFGDSSGNYSAPVKNATIQDVRNITAAELNNDGKLDIVLVTSTGPLFMLGNGAGNFTLFKTYAVGFSTYYYMAPVFADFDEDGKTDFAVAEGSGIAVAYGDGAGRFNSALSVRLKVTRPREMVLSDFNNDGHQDFALISADIGGLPGASSVGVYLGDGNGNFAEQPLITFFSGLVLTSVAAADFNRDGKADLAVNVQQNKIAFLAGDGTGRFALDTQVGIANNPPSTSTYPYAPLRIKSADLNGDGNPDLLMTTTNYNNLVAMLGDGAGGFTLVPGPQLQGASDFVHGIAIADFNADGKLDAAVVKSDVQGVQVFSGDGSGHFSSYAFAQLLGSPLSVVAPDLNNDGKPDLVVSSSGFSGAPDYTPLGYVSVIMGHGAGPFGTLAQYPVEGVGATTGALAVGDFNNDGKRDVVFSGGTLGGIGILTNDGIGGLYAQVNFSIGGAGDYILASDFNSDGKDDVIVSQPNSNTVGMLLNNFTAALPCLRINDVLLTEGDSGTTNAVFSVILYGDHTQTVRVNYFAESYSLYQAPAATKGADFQPVNGTLTFAPGVNTQSITVPIKGDTIDEFDELFDIKLTGAVRANISDMIGMGRITDNDAPPSISINDVSVREGSAFSTDQRSAPFIVSLSAASEKPIDMQYSTSAGTATPGTDYTQQSGKLSFPAGTTTMGLPVPIVPDTTFEPDETFFANLSGATNATIADAQGQATILNDDPQPTVTIVGRYSQLEGTAGPQQKALLQVTLSNPSSQPITVNYATADGTATAGSDYVAASGSLLFNPDETSKLISIQINDDNLDEIDETFNVVLSNATNATLGSTSQTLFFIFDDDGPNISINDVKVTEGDTGTVDANFTISLSAVSPQDVYVQFATANGTASSIFDYQRVFSRTAIIPAGKTSETVTVHVVGDYQIEPDETFFVNLSNPDDGTIVRYQGVGTIVNDDSPGTLQFSAAAYTVNEDGGSAAIMIKRTGGSTGSVTVDFSTGDGTAKAGSDYVAASGKLTFIEGETSKSFTVPVLDDQLSEGDETVNLTLSNPTGGAKLGEQSAAVLTIADIEPVGAKLAYSSSSFVAGEGDGSARITVTRTGNSAGSMSVDYAVTDGSAQQRSDYTVASGSLIFAAGETEKSFNLLITDDAYAEGSESVNLSLSNPSGDAAELGAQSTAVLTINDNDTAAPSANPIDDNQFFVRQHYLDFLSRAPDAGGLGYWTGELTSCGLDVSCLNSRRVAVSAAYFVETEFQDTGSFVYRFYKASYGQRPTYAQFMPDRSRVVGGASLEDGKQAFANAWVQRQEFLSRYPSSLSGPQFIDALLQTVLQGSGVDLTGRRQAFIDDYNANQSRARLVRMVADEAAFKEAEYSRAFVLMQYFGYLRRDPEEGGYLFWLDVLNNKVPGNYRGMVCSFITSQEYQERFSSVSTRSNRDCANIH